jgi:hypothetical protein
MHQHRPFAFGSLTLTSLAFAALLAQPASARSPAQSATRTPAPTARATATRPARTPTPAKPAAKTTSAAPAGAALAPAKAYEAAKKDPCALVKVDAVAKLIGARGLSAVGETRGAEYLCVYSNGQNYYNVVSISRDDDGSVFASALARYDVNKGCGRDKRPADADLAPYRKMALADKLKRVVEQSNKCGAKYKPVAEFGPNAFIDDDNLLIVIDTYLLNTYVQESTAADAALKLARLAFSK